MRIILFASALLAVAASTASAQSPTGPIEFGSFTFTSSRGTTAVADSGTLTVPKNRNHPGRGTIAIPVVRFRSTSSLPGAPVVYLSGGSGSGIATARGSRFEMFMALRVVGDVITLDLRGAGSSKPRVDCGVAGLPEISQAPTYDAIVHHLAARARTCADSLREAGVDLSGHNVREVVADVEQLRRALGAAKINLLGISTGSQLVLEYLRRHPTRVERVVAAGVQAPDQNLHMPAEQDLILRTLSETAGGPHAGVVNLLRTVLDTLQRGPRTVAVRRGTDTTVVGLGMLDVQLLVSGTLGDRRQMAFLPTILGAAARGDYVMLAGAKIAATRSGITSAYETVMDCQTSAPQARARQRRRQADSSLLGIATLDFPEHCSAWGVTPLDESYRKPVRSAAPVLLISGTLDGRTPVSNARAALAHLPNGSHLIIDGASHGDDLFLSSPEIVPTMVRFLTGGAPLPRHLFLKARYG